MKIKYLGRHIQLAPINYNNNEVAEYYSAKKGSPISSKKGLPIPYTHELAEQDTYADIAHLPISKEQHYN